MPKTLHFNMEFNIYLYKSYDFHINSNKFIFQLLSTGDLGLIFQELVPPAVLCLTTLYIFCHFGDHFKERFEDLTDAIHRLNWYNFPISMQKDAMLMIGAAQNEVLLNGYAGTCCTRNVFKKVINTTFSYFTVLREFE